MRRIFLLLHIPPFLACICCMVFLSATHHGYFAPTASDVHTTVVDVSRRPVRIYMKLSIDGTPRRNGQICSPSSKVTRSMAKNDHNAIDGVYKYPQNPSVRSPKASVNLHRISVRSARPSVNSHKTSVRSPKPSVNAHRTSVRSGEPSVNAHRASVRSAKLSVNPYKTSVRSAGPSVSL